MFRRAPKHPPVPPEPELPPEGLDDEDFPDPFDTEFSDAGDVAEDMTTLAAEGETLPEVVDVSRLSPSGRRAPSRGRHWVWWVAGVSVLLVGVLAASWFALPVKQVEVTGERQLTEKEVKTLAGLRGQVGWLYYGRGRAAGLLRNPWVQSAVVTRQFPDTVRVEITERQPFMQMRNRQGQPVLVAQDGRVLPWKPGFETLPMVSGWGPERLPDAVLVAHALSRYTVQSVAYTPSGLTVKTAAGTVWSGDLKSLLKYAGSISMYPNQNINVYPWGVSVQ